MTNEHWFSLAALRIVWRNEGVTSGGPAISMFEFSRSLPWGRIA